MPSQKGTDKGEEAVPKALPDVPWAVPETGKQNTRTGKEEVVPMAIPGALWANATVNPLREPSKRVQKRVWL